MVKRESIGEQQLAVGQAFVYKSSFKKMKKSGARGTIMIQIVAMIDNPQFRIRLAGVG